MGLSQTGPSQSKVGIDLNRSLISHERFGRAFFRVAIAIKSALKVTLVRLHIFCPAFFRGLHLRLNHRFRRWIRGATRELTAQFFHDGLGEFGLNSEHVFQITSKIFRPDLLAGLSLSEPCR